LVTVKSDIWYASIDKLRRSNGAYKINANVAADTGLFQRFVYEEPLPFRSLREEVTFQI